MGEGVLTKLLRIVYEIFFSNAPKTLCFTRHYLIAGIADLEKAVEERLFTLFRTQHVFWLLFYIISNLCLL